MANTTNAALEKDWWRGAAIYQIYPRSYFDTNGDGLGDLNGVTEKLAHAASLGVDAVWLSPFFKSPMADMGYDVSDFCDVDPIFGTLEDFNRTIERAHALGLKVIIDQVLSHTSDRHKWFEESRKSRTNAKADWYVWADPKPDGTPPNNWLSIFGGSAWEWDGKRKQYYLHNFLASQPDLNFHTAAVRKAVLETVEFWLKRGVDGLRLDTVNYYFHDRKLRDNPPTAKGGNLDIPDVNPYGWQDHIHDKTQPENLGFLRELRSLLDRYDNRTTVGEIGDGANSLKTLAAYTSGGDKLHMSYTFDLLSDDFSAAHIGKSVGAFEQGVKDGWVCWAFSNHDVRRHVSRFARAGENPAEVARFAITILACLRGSICLYQGEELGLGEADIAFEDLRDPYGIRFWPAFKGRDGCRTPMPWTSSAPQAGFSGGKPWLPVPAEHRALNAAAQDITLGSTLKHYRAILALRKAHPALVKGNFALSESPADVLSFVRTLGKEKLFCAFNFSRSAKTMLLPGRAEKTAYAHAANLADGKLVLGAMGAAIISLG